MHLKHAFSCGDSGSSYIFNRVDRSPRVATSLLVTQLSDLRVGFTLSECLVQYYARQAWSPLAQIKSMMLLLLLLLLLLLFQASRLRRGQASTVRLFLARHGSCCQSLSCSGPKSGGEQELATVSASSQR